ncbi:MAG TPA: DUF58 domain-containing protein [Vicinamibacterales bacterium]|nr:DUF58 domain-containing protein [Vicinamibacterales bacterium]
MARRRLPFLPARLAIATVTAAGIVALAALLAGADPGAAVRVSLAALAALALIGGWDYAASRRAWRRASPRLTRRMPSAFAIGVRKPVELAIEIDGTGDWQCEVYDHADATLSTEGLPVRLRMRGGTRVTTTYTAMPTLRGEVTFAPADIRVRSRWGLCELLETIGTPEVRRVYPDFAQVARYAWLAGDRRLQEIGIKTYQRRGQGTDFKQLSDYRTGDSVRHVDWRATLRLGKPIVREFQDERDQCVLFLVDCGRRMRADDRDQGVGTTHFDQVLNAVMLLTYVALKQGDAVGAMTFGSPAGDERAFAPRKGTHALNALMGELYGVQPTPTHSDYVAAAQELLRKQPKRALVIVITNFRDEDSTELGHALRLLRSRHLVLLASLRERVVRELIAQPLGRQRAAIEIASAHLYEQARRDAFARLAARDAMMVDAEPERLGIELVNRYHAIKRAGLI